MGYATRSLLVNDTETRQLVAFGEPHVVRVRCFVTGGAATPLPGLDLPVEDAIAIYDLDTLYPPPLTLE